MEQDLGLAEQKQKDVAGRLQIFLAESYALYLKTQNYHWNVTGKHFYGLHNMFEEQYTELAESIDEIAERVRALGEKAPGSFKRFNEMSELSEPISGSAEDMVADLTKSHEFIVRKAREFVDFAEENGDVGTADFLTARIEVHEKAAWMLKSTLE